MENEEKEEKETKVSEEDSDFADEAKPAVPETPAEEEKKEPEEQINLYSEKEEETVVESETKETATTSETKTESLPEKDKKNEPVYQYTDKDLADIEAARNSFHKIYKKLNLIKWIITGVGLVLVIAGWIVPSVISGINANITMYISLGVTAVVLVALAVYSVLFRKKVDAAMKSYFKKYYDCTCHFVYPK